MAIGFFEGGVGLDEFFFLKFVFVVLVGNGVVYN